MESTNLITVSEAASTLQCSEQFVRQLLREGVIQGTRLKSVWLIDKTTFDPKDITLRKNKVNPEDRKSSIPINRNDDRPFRALSFFSGAGGLDIGLEQAGIEILLTCEVDKASRRTLTANKPQVGLIGDILNYSSQQILEYAGLREDDEVDLIVGGPPCQAFSTAGRRKGFEDKRGNVFLRYLDVILDLQPLYAVIENVRGLLSSKLSIDIPDDLIDSVGDISNIPGSAFWYAMSKLKAGGYNISFNLYNSANYGSPQVRERVVVICTRDENPVPFLAPTHSQNPEYNLDPWVTFGEAVEGLKEEDMHYIEFSEKRLRYLRMLGPGQNWRNLPEEIQPEAMGGSYNLGGGKTGFYRRLAWDKPAPTLVTHPAMPATELCHPIMNRPLSIEEYKRVQEFPDTWEICGTIIEQYRQIGNAVPIGLGRAIGTAILSHANGEEVWNPEGFKYSRYKNTCTQSWYRSFQEGIKKPSLAEQLEIF